MKGPESRKTTEREILPFKKNKKKKGQGPCWLILLFDDCHCDWECYLARCVKYSNFDCLVV